MRTFMWEDHANGGIPWQNMTREIEDAQRSTTHIARAAQYADWHRNHIPTIVKHQAAEISSSTKITTANIRQKLTKQSPLPLTQQDHQHWKNNTQRTIYRQLRQELFYNTEERLRQKLKFWRLDGRPRIQATRCLKNLRLLMKRMAPRVALTCWHTIFRRWTTARRFGKRNSECLMGCGRGEDDIDHYPFCRTIRSWAQARLQLKYTPDTAKQTWTFTLDTPQAELCKTALLIYSAYRATNHFRHAGMEVHDSDQQQAAKEYLNQVLHEADHGNHPFHIHGGIIHSQHTKRKITDDHAAQNLRSKKVQRTNTTTHSEVGQPPQALQPLEQGGHNIHLNTLNPPPCTYRIADEVLIAKHPMPTQLYVPTLTSRQQERDTVPEQSCPMGSAPPLPEGANASPSESDTNIRHPDGRHCATTLSSITCPHIRARIKREVYVPAHHLGA